MPPSDPFSVEPDVATSKLVRTLLHHVRFDRPIRSVIEAMMFSQDQAIDGAE